MFNWFVAWVTILALFFLCRCSGAPFESAASLSISSDANGAFSDEPLTESEHVVRDAGLERTASEEIRGDAGLAETEVETPSDDARVAPPRDVMNDPWPDDVEVRPVNCFLNQVGTWSCCWGSTPAMTCEGHDAKFCMYCVEHP